MALSLGLPLGLSSLSQGGGANDFRTSMPAGATYTRTGQATGRTVAGLIGSFAANAPQQTDRGLALEPARTNIMAYSQEIDNAVWSKTGLTVTANNIAAPDGTTTAEKLTTSGSAAIQRFTRSGAHTGNHTYSIFAKAGSASFLQILNSNDSTMFANFNLATGAIGTVGAGATATMSAFSGGWYRCAITINVAAGALMFYVVPAATSAFTAAYTATVADLYVWGVQNEAGTYASSYILTGAASATRGLPVFTEPVPAGITKALLTYYDASTTLVTGLTPGGTFDAATAVVGASKGVFGASELVTRVWRA